MRNFSERIEALAKEFGVDVQHKNSCIKIRDKTTSEVYELAFEDAEAAQNAIENAKRSDSIQVSEAPFEDIVSENKTFGFGIKNRFLRGLAALGVTIGMIACAMVGKSSAAEFRRDAEKPKAEITLDYDDADDKMDEDRSAKSMRQIQTEDKIKAEPELNRFPLYFAVDLKTGEREVLNAEPSGGWGDEYKTTKILMRQIPKGSFMMGASPMKGENGKLTQISNDFYIAPFETTQAQWVSVMGDNPAYFKGDNRPVEHVSWNDCQEFIKRLNKIADVEFCLPTEEDWEYACRAGSAGDWGKRANGEEGPLDVMGWYGENSGDETHPVAQKEPNAWGLYDMHGNVWEWASSLRDALGSSRMRRGGGWYGRAQYCRCATRIDDPPSGYSTGFRLACSSGLDA